MVVNGGSTLRRDRRRRGDQRRRHQPRPDALHQRRRQRIDLPLRRLAQRRKMLGNELPRHPGLQTGDRRGEDGQNRATSPRSGATSKSSPTSSTRPTAKRKTRPRGRAARSSPRSSSTSPTPPAPRAATTTRGITERTTSSTTPSAPAPTASKPGSSKGRAGRPPARARRRIPTPKTKNIPAMYDYSNDSYLETAAKRPTRGSSSAKTTPPVAITCRPASRPRSPRSTAGSPTRFPSVFRNDQKRDARVLHPVAERRTLCRAALRLPLQTPRSRRAAGRDRHPADQLQRRQHAILDLRLRGKPVLAARSHGPGCGCRCRSTVRRIRSRPATDSASR